MSDELQEETDSRQRLDRRALLRRGGIALAGVAAAQAIATPADAAVGNMQFGAANDATTDSTGLTSTNAGTTFQLANTGNGAPLRLANRTPPAAYFANSVPGDLISMGGVNPYVLNSLVYTHLASPGAGQDAFWGEVYTDLFANFVAPLEAPVRVCDTRNLAGRANITNPSALDSAGRLRGGATAVIDIQDLAIFPTVFFGNITVAGALNNGYLTVYSSGSRPNASNLNYVKNVAIANSLISRVQSTGTAEEVRVFSSATTHLFLDIAAFSVGSINQVNPAVLPGVAAAAKGAPQRAVKRKLPSWYRGSPS